MLELKNVCKTYKTKGGVQVQALKDVSLSFEEKGMVFLLGKSGSGKSTLLNLCGGLDSPDSGEIIVKGRSSKEFSGADFDSYRNTFIGFIFQEYNILDEFTVEENIALALELQGKKKDKAVIDDILRQVDLEGYAKRKPATLSGGQKQRIAIARALVKNPQIIMADEPTGALDSNTGKQVFDTLKKLSDNKLVLIVSHDRDFAETYADRIIELADGQVISDVYKSEGEREDIDSNVTVTDAGFITVKKGSELTPAAIKKINDLLKNTDSDIIISTDSRSNAGIRQAGKINDNGSVDVFRQTEQQPAVKEYEEKDSRFIRSRLPVSKAVKIGASGLKGKPFRLVITTFLSCVAFILFGLMSTFMMYDPAVVKSEAIKDTSEKYLSVTLSREWETLKIGDTTIANLEKATGIRPVGVLQTNNIQFNGDTVKNTEIKYSMIYNPMGAIVYDPAQMEAMDIKLVAGTWPGKEETVENDWGSGKIIPIAISCFQAQMYIDMGINNRIISDDPALSDKKIEGYEDLVGMPLTFGIDQASYYRISGIFDCGAIDKAYENLTASSENYNLQYQYSEYMQNALHTALIINSESKGWFLQENSESSKMVIYNTNGDILQISYQSDMPAAVCINGEGNTVGAVQGDDIYIPFYYVRYVIEDYYKDNYDETIREKLDSVYYVDEENGGYHDYSRFADEAKLKEVTPELFAMFLDCYRFVDGTTYSGQTGGGRMVDMNVAGICYDREEVSGDTCVVSDDFVYSDRGNVTKDTNEIYKSVLIPIKDLSDEQIEVLININSVEKLDDSTTLRVTTPFIANIDNVSELIGMLGKIFLYTGIVLAVFAALLLFNFISASISQKKKEIGILRAVGARGSDVFKIFFAETLIIVIICLIISITLSAVLCTVINNMIKEQSASVSYDLLIFGPVNALIILAIAIAVGIIGTFIPVYLTARKKPVEAIRAL